LHAFAQKHPRALVLTKSDALQDIVGSKDFSVTLLGKQGSFYLLRLLPGSSEWVKPSHLTADFH
jgi:hypothetical protein